MLSDTDFLNVINLTPLVAIDLLIKNSNGDILLGKRNNRPAMGYWFVPGGRILKNETFDVAFERIVKNELNQQIAWDTAKFFGCFQHLYPDNFLNSENISTHYVVLSYEINLDTKQYNADLSEQHTEQAWWTIEDILASEEVHPNTKAYFRPNEG